MPILVSVTVPIALARAEAAGAHKALADSPHFQAKVVLSQAFGEGRIRPWRLLDSSGGVHTLAGWARSLDDLQPNPESRRLGVVVEDLEWKAPQQGETVVLDVLAAPHKQVTHPSGKKVYIDVAARLDAAGRLMTPSPTERRALWSSWLADALTAPRTGLMVNGRPTIVGDEKIWTIRAERRDRMHIQTAHAIFKARVAEPSAFVNFLSVGFKKNKDIGLGMILPAELTLPALLAEAA